MLTEGDRERCPFIIRQLRLVATQRLDLSSSTRALKRWNFEIELVDGLSLLAGIKLQRSVLCFCLEFKTSHFEGETGC